MLIHVQIIGLLIGYVTPDACTCLLHVDDKLHDVALFLLKISYQNIIKDSIKCTVHLPGMCNFSEFV